MDRNSENESTLPDTPGGQPPEKVEDRPSVGQVEPEDYPEPANAAQDMGAGEPGESSENYDPRGTAAGAAKGAE